MTTHERSVAKGTSNHRVRCLVFAACLLALATTVSCSSNNPVDDVAGGILVGKALDDFGTRLASIASTAAQHGDYLVEKNARKFRLLARDASFLLSEELDRRTDQLSTEHQKLLNVLREGIDELEAFREVPLELEDFILLDLQNVINQLPFKEDVYLLRRINGYSQVYRETGVYRFGIIGSAFGPGYFSEIYVNGKKVGPITMQTSRAHTLEFSVPANSLNDRFAVDAVTRVELSIKCTKSGNDKVVFSYSDKILLLPKYPVAYELTEHKTVQEWSEEEFWSEIGTAVVGRTDKPAEGEEPANTGTVSVTIPEGCKMIKDSAISWIEPKMSYGRWTEEISYSDADRTVSRTFKHWLPNHDRQLFIKVKYRNPKHPIIDDRLYVTEEAYKERLPFGTYFANLSNEYQSYTCKVTWFNGDKSTLSPAGPIGRGVRIDNENKVAFKRLAIKVWWPDQGANK